MCNKCVWLWKERPKAKTLKINILIDWAESEAEKRVKLIKFKLCTIPRLLSLSSYLCKNNNPNWSDSTNYCAFFFSTRRKIAFPFVFASFESFLFVEIWAPTDPDDCGKVSLQLNAAGKMQNEHVNFMKRWEQKLTCFMHLPKKQILFANFFWEIFAIYF